jgi:hypothetical protein
MKQTAVEWLLQQIENKNGKEFSSYYQEFVEQAKTMEKEQIINAYNDGFQYETTQGIHYYNETFKSE